MTMNVGQAPADLQAPIGQFRLLANDLASTPLNPNVAGRGQYELFSDAEIAAFINLYPTSMLRSVGVAYMTLAGRAATESAITKDYDLQVDLTKKAADLRATATAYFTRADAENDMTGDDSTFGITGGVYSQSIPTHFSGHLGRADWGV